MPDARIARKYARALVEAVPETDNQNKVLEELKSLIELFQADSILPV